MTTHNVIRKDGWLYWLAYGRRAEQNRPTGKVNLCDTIWFAMWWGLAFVLLGVIVAFFVGVVISCILVLCLMVRNDLPAIIAWLTDPSLPPDIKHTLIGIVVIAVFVAAVLSLLHGVSALAKCEPVRLFAAYLRAKKERVCPIYEVV